MSIEKYFQREYNFLQVAGEEFAEKHQAIAGMLRLTERQRKDPFVERLLEAFAFLTGRIHERLDDEMPEFTGGLLEQLLPHFLRPFPSCAILQASPAGGGLKKMALVPRGSEVETPEGKYFVKYRIAATAEEKARILEKKEAAEFIFRTTLDLELRPMELKEVRMEEQPDGTTALLLTIEPNPDTSYHALDMRRLRLFLHGAESVKYPLLLYLTRYVKKITLREISMFDNPPREITAFHIGIPGLEDYDTEAESALLPYARQVFKGFRLLHEFFAFRERFFFVDVEGLHGYEALPQAFPFEITFYFDRKFPRENRPDTRNILLHCTPIINLFDRPAEQVSVDQRMPEYYIIPDLNRRKSREIFSVNSVVGVARDQHTEYRYLPVTSYDMLDTNDPEYEYKRFYSTFTRPLKADMAETYIRLFGPSMEEDILPRETLSIQATLSNGFLPSKYLEVGSLTEGKDFGKGITISNITAPGEVLQPPDQQNWLWAVISHLSLNFQTLADAETLKKTLSLYNWVDFHNNPNKKIIESIVRVHPPARKNLFRDRGVIRGIELKIEVDGSYFEHGRPEIYLFGSVLNRFLREYITINSFVILKIVEVETKEAFTWEPSPGQILPV